MMAAMDIFGIVGWSGSGKTTLIRALLPVLAGRGLVVGTLKHSHHALDYTDSAIAPLLDGGATQCVVAGPDRLAMAGRWPDAEPPGLAVLARQCAGVDLLLVEGFKTCRHPRLEVWNSTSGKPMLIADDRLIKAVASDVSRPAGLPAAITWFNRDDIVPIADFIQAEHVSVEQL